MAFAAFPPCPSVSTCFEKKRAASEFPSGLSVLVSLFHNHNLIIVSLYVGLQEEEEKEVKSSLLSARERQR